MSEQEENPSFVKKVDESWKEQVEREKKIGEKAPPKPSPTAQVSVAPGQKPPKVARPENLPAGGEFVFLLSSLSMEALRAMGEMPDPRAGVGHVDLEQARLLIDILGMLQEKTRGNLTPEEASMLESLLYELRMKFVAKQGGV